MKVSPEMGEGGSQEQECRQNKAQLINSLQVVNTKTGYHDDDYNDDDAGEHYPIVEQHMILMV